MSPLRLSFLLCDCLSCCGSGQDRPDVRSERGLWPFQSRLNKEGRGGKLTPAAVSPHTLRVPVKDTHSHISLSSLDHPELRNPSRNTINGLLTCKQLS